MRFFKLIYLVLLLLSFGRSLQAQTLNLLDDSAPVAVHQKKSGPKFPEKEKVNGKDGSVPGIPALVFYSLDSQLPVGAGTYDVLPDCRSSQVRREAVLVDQEELKYFDLLFYNYSDSAQVAKADRWELPSAPYLEGDVYNPFREENLQQDMGRVFQIKCLPTRFHFVSVDGSRYLEYREGERAWDREP